MYQKDILTQDLYEIDNVALWISFEINVSNVITYLFTNILIYLFPNLVISIRIFLTLPVRVASGEISFSKLKIIKNNLRSTMGQERLLDLFIYIAANSSNNSGQGVSPGTSTSLPHSNGKGKNGLLPTAKKNQLGSILAWNITI